MPWHYNGSGRWPAACLAGFVLGCVALLAVLDELNPPDMTRFETRSLEVRASGGELLRVFPVEDGRLRQQVSLDEVDPLFIAMLLAFEDKRFYHHGGVDGRALARAMYQAVTSGEVVSGASTLTMQVAKLLEPRSRTVGAKIIEMFRAWQLEGRFSKKQILEMYLTLAPYGGNLEGIKAASSAYFGHDTKHMTPEEAALLVALPQSPTRLRPDRHSADARRARDKVLKRVAPLVGLDPHLAKLAADVPVASVRHVPDIVAAHAASRLRFARSNTDMVLHTTLDFVLQKRLERLALSGARGVHEQASAAILVVDNKTRTIKAYVGSAGIGEGRRLGYVDMVRAVRSPGSTLKPFIYGMAFDEGLAAPETRLRDEPRNFGGYTPNNFMDRHYGEVSIAEALALSLNVPAVAVLDRLGPVNFAQRLRDQKIPLVLPGAEKAGLAIALGGLGMTLEDLTAMYAALADDGVVRPLKLQQAGAEDHLPDHALMRPPARFAVARILANISPPEGRLVPNSATQRQIAYKTGTSYGFRDAWAIGFDGDHTVGVWLGRADGTPIPGHFGAASAAPLLFDVFDNLEKGGPAPWEQAAQTAQATSAFETLPPGLKYFDRAERLIEVGAHVASLNITFPVPDSVLEITGETTPLTLLAEGGKRPLQWFVDGVPVQSGRWARNASYQLRGEGFYGVTVVDALGQRSTAKIRAVRPRTSAPEGKLGVLTPVAD
ncbi:penicillin-binding protein 1C [Kordiimonas sp.]|uniref:penicillin-binding protein 1C n=1 Tax=Kordiimonas sp. TaxID=1970157 RepID=UPI003A9466B4